MKTQSSAGWRTLLLIATALAVPIVPFLAFGDAMEAWFAGWLDDSLPRSTAAAMVVGLLAVDIFLPVPSSLVSTFAGRTLGFLGGTAASWGGMTAGAAAAFALVRLFGRGLAVRFSSEKEIARMDELARRYGILLLVLLRPVPVFAEASVLWMGVTKIGWRAFLLAVGLSNLAIAAAYALLGRQVPLAPALAAAVAIPLLGGAIAKWLLPKAG